VLVELKYVHTFVHKNASMFRLTIAFFGEFQPWFQLFAALEINSCVKAKSEFVGEG
jgi:hypothetical protein